MSDRSPGRSTLVLEDAFAAGSGAACLDGLLDGETRTAVLSVLYRGQVADRLDALRARRESVDSAAVVSVGPAADGAGHRETAAVRAVPDPADLTGVGMAASEWVQGRAADERAVVCVDSLSTLLQYADSDRAFRFLHALLGQFRTAGIGAHVHMDPTAHDERTVAQFRQLFDEVREAPEMGSHGSHASTAAARGVATDGGKPSSAPDGDRPDGDRPDGDRPDGDRPDGDRPDCDRPDRDGRDSAFDGSPGE